MRIEGHDNSLTAKSAGALGHVAYDFLMRAMHAVEVAHADYGWPEVGRYFFEIAENLQESMSLLVLPPPGLYHYSSNSRFKPSYDKRTFSGKSAFVSWWGRSCEMCVKNVRFGLSCSTIFSEFSTVECVGCGLCRKASRNRMSSPC